MSKIHPSGSKSAFSALPVVIFAAIALLFQQKFPSAEQKMHLFELEKRNLDILLIENCCRLNVENHQLSGMRDSLNETEENGIGRAMVCKNEVTAIFLYER